MTNQEPKLNRIEFHVDEDYEFDYEIILSNEGDNDILITIPDTVEILITDFHVSKTVVVNTPSTEDTSTNVTVSYPLDELPQDYEGLTLRDLLDYQHSVLTVVITSEKVTEVVRKHSTLWIGTNVSMILPNEFAEKLQHFLTTGELTNE